MEKLNRSPVELIGDICLIAFLLPSAMKPFEGGVGQLIAFGQVSPWCALAIDPPPLSGVQPGLHFEFGLSWFFLLIFLVTRFVAKRETDYVRDYFETTRQARNFRRNVRQRRRK
ncbi:MAG: hypothetical protein SFU56_21485 [Capsulimonadales bacterium]|nr:hypothetical protein [Capsulimonadales bacterium]